MVSGYSPLLLRPSAPLLLHMKRLWIQQSLAFLSIILLMIMIPFGFQAAVMHSGYGAERFIERVPEVAEIVESIPPHVVQAIERESERNFLIGITFFLVLSGLLSLGAGVFVSKRLTAPLEELVHGAKAIEAQEFGHRVHVAGSQEMAEVAHAFNSMAERLEQAEKLRRNLLADVAHELRNPLHVLQGNLQAILDGVYPLEGEEIGRLLTHTQHLTSLVSDLHELAQAEAKQLPLHKSEVNVAELVKETAATFQPSAVAKQISLQVELLGKHPIVQVDKVRLRQVVSNLLNNALHYTAVGGRVQISVAQEEGQVVVRVADSGDGIAAEELPYVFDRFYRADKSRQRDYGHTGLGLAIVRAIMEAHGGEVAAESGGVGQGSVFVVRLPIKSEK